MITIIDFGAGNIQSLINALVFLGERVRVGSQPKEIVSAEKVIFPGVGNFGEAMRTLKKRNLIPAIRRNIQKGAPFLGICLGFQLLFEESEEANWVEGIKIFKGRVLRFQKVKVPQIGWNQIEIKKRDRIFTGIQNKSFVYFVHSFYVKPSNRKIISGTANYGRKFVSAISFQNIFGVQFHPEKSGSVGLKILKNFVNI